MTALAQALINSHVIQMIYIGSMMAILIVPMVALSIWYHRSIGTTAGGRRLMELQRAWQMRPRSAGVSLTELKTSVTAIYDVHSGVYGSKAKAMHVTVYKVCGLWIVALGLVGSLPFAVGWLAGA